MFETSLKNLKIAHVYACHSCDSETSLVHEVKEPCRVSWLPCPMDGNSMYRYGTKAVGVGGVLGLLLWIGFIRIREHGDQAGTIKWPFSNSPRWIWRHHLLHGPRFQVFRNKEGVIKRLPGRLLPRRWGGAILGFEFGDRG